MSERSHVANAVIGTASKYIELPYSDFINFLTYLLGYNKLFKFTNNEIQAKVKCAELNL